tara:strand:- start:3236 stop:4039 length:804 start_codon:yes stop_codon:yes gene_type:complete
MKNKDKHNLLIVTDIDGTLMDHKYDLSPALATITKVKNMKIPIVLCTSKTASEVRSIRKDIAIDDPYIVENGAAIYGNHINKISEWELILGRSYKDLRRVLDYLAEVINYPLRALNDLSYKEINQLTGLNSIEIEKALDRHWSVPFLNPPEKYRNKLQELALLNDLNIFQGNRMSHLLSVESHKGKAVNALKKYLNKSEAYVIALGDSQNDIPLLEVADKAIVVPGINGPNKFLEQGITDGDFILAPAPHAKGWSLAVSEAINQYGC